MENATKALLIAAAVLIVIMIIGIALKISSSSTSAGEQAINSGNSIEVQTWNAQFIQYEGIQNRNTIANLLEFVIKLRDEKKDNGIQVNTYSLGHANFNIPVKNKDGSSDSDTHPYNTIISNLRKGYCSQGDNHIYYESYNVEFIINNSTGFIKNIKITPMY